MAYIAEILYSENYERWIPSILVVDKPDSDCRFRLPYVRIGASEYTRIAADSCRKRSGNGSGNCQEFGREISDRIESGFFQPLSGQCSRADLAFSYFGRSCKNRTFTRYQRQYEINPQKNQKGGPAGSAPGGCRDLPQSTRAGQRQRMPACRQRSGAPSLAARSHRFSRLLLELVLDAFLLQA